MDERDLNFSMGSALTPWLLGLKTLYDPRLLKKTGCKFSKKSPTSEFNTLVEGCVQERFEKFIHGVVKYQKFNRDYKNFDKEQDRVPFWSSGSASVYGYKTLWPFTPKAIAFFISAPMNNPSIFHLPANNFAKHLLKLSILPIFLDWGKHTHKENYDMTGYIEHILMPAYKTVYEQFKLPIYTFGYCLGGVLTNILSVLLKDSQIRPAGSVLMATPWNFRCYQPSEQQLIDRFITKYAKNVSLSIQELNGLLKKLLSSLQAGTVINKFSKFADEENEKKIELFVQVEDWINDLRPLSEKFFSECLMNFFKENRLFNKKLYINNQLIDSDFVNHSVFIITPTKDKIVPFNASDGLVGIDADVTAVRPNVGHVGFMVGSRSEEEFVFPCMSWLSNSIKSRKNV